MALRYDSVGDAVRAAYEIQPQHSQQKRHAGNNRCDQPRLPETQVNVQDTLAQAQALNRQGKLAEAWEIAEHHLAYIDPNNPHALTIGLDVWRKQNKPALAYQFARRIADLAPKESTAWSNLGMIEDSLYRFPEAEKCFRRALELSRGDKEKAGLYTNWACMLINRGDWIAAEPVARRALEYSPDSAKAKANLGLCCLALRKWKEGWPLYDAVIGFDQSRRKVQYKDEPVWDGSKGKRVVVYGEQGLGDEISFASMLPDLIRDSASVVVDCTDRLQGLFARSFPKATVYGTRWEKGLGWDRKHADVDASISIGALGKFYRNANADFPRAPYLVPDPERVAMWRGLFASLGKPVIGLAWTGGVAWTADRFRQWKLDDLLPLFGAKDAVWISLQYKDAGREIAEFRARHPEVDLRQYAYGTLTQDYDDTAAMVAALDLVVAMQTTVLHLAGAMGKPCWGFVNKHSQWRYGEHDQRGMPWYESVKLYRQPLDGGWPIDEAARDLELWQK